MILTMLQASIKRALKNCVFQFEGVWAQTNSDTITLLRRPPVKLRPASPQDRLASVGLSCCWKKWRLLKLWSWAKKCEQAAPCIAISPPKRFAIKILFLQFTCNLSVLASWYGMINVVYPANNNHDNNEAMMVTIGLPQLCDGDVQQRSLFSCWGFPDQSIPGAKPYHTIPIHTRCQATIIIDYDMFVLMIVKMVMVSMMMVSMMTVIIMTVIMMTMTRVSPRVSFCWWCVIASIWTWWLPCSALPRRWHKW